MNPQGIINMMRNDILGAFDREIWEWAGLDTYRDPEHQEDVFRGRLRRTGTMEYHDFFFSVNFAMVEQNTIDWYRMLVDRAVHTLGISMDQQKVIDTVSVIDDEEVKEIWY